MHKSCTARDAARILALLIALVPQPLLVAQDAAAEGSFRFAFIHHKGDKFRVLSEVDEEVYVNGRRSHTAEILNRIAFSVTDAAKDGSWGLLKGSFETSEREKGQAAYLIAESYDSEFRRDRLGRYRIEPKYYMPVVRDLPVFPDKTLAVGETWTAAGEERHDFRRAFGIPDPYVIPFEARYRYEGDTQSESGALKVIAVSYTIFHRPAAPRAYTRAYPIQIAGFSEQRINWDPVLGQPVSYEERFHFVFDWSDGNSIEYRGSARSRLLEAKTMDRDALRRDLEQAVKGMPNVSVTSTAEGVTISIEDIQFEADSARLKPEELAKIERIADILKRYPERDVLVAGHAAAAGYAPGRLPLSEARAKTVAERLITLGARADERIRAAGYGDTRPIADNGSEKGRARNRRVEITILEN